MFTLISCTAMAGVAEWICCPGEKNSLLYDALILLLSAAHIVHFCAHRKYHYTRGSRNDC